MLFDAISNRALRSTTRSSNPRTLLYPNEFIPVLLLSIAASPRLGGSKPSTTVTIAALGIFGQKWTLFEVLGRLADAVNGLQWRTAGGLGVWRGGPRARGVQLVSGDSLGSWGNRELIPVKVEGMYTPLQSPPKIISWEFPPSYDGGMARRALLQLWTGRCANHANLCLVVAGHTTK